jgi:hypothetical protein
MMKLIYYKDDSTYYDDNLDPIDVSKNFPYSTTAVAKMLRHREVNGNIKLRRFLTEMEVINRGIPAQQFLEAGFFTLVYKPRYRNCDPVIKISEMGVVFIKNLVNKNITEYKNKERALKNLNN